MRLLPSAERSLRGRSVPARRVSRSAVAIERRAVTGLSDQSRACSYYSTRGDSGAANASPATLVSAMRRALPVLVCLLVVAAVAAAAVTLAGTDSEQPASAAPPESEARAALAGAPAPLAALHAQSNELLGGGVEAFNRRLAGLKGYPVVVNLWGSWCPPCRAEFPYFQSQAIERGKQVAFLGVDGDDNDPAASAFLEDFPVAYPSYTDPDLKIAAEIKALGVFPATVFYDRKGRISHLKQGGYPDERALAADVERYAR